jgi:hypothetical protein
MAQEAGRVMMRRLLAVVLVALLAFGGAGAGTRTGAARSAHSSAAPARPATGDADTVTEADAASPVTDRETTLTTQTFASAGVSRAPPARRA